MRIEFTPQQLDQIAERNPELTPEDIARINEMALAGMGRIERTYHVDENGLVLDGAERDEVIAGRTRL